MIDETIEIKTKDGFFSAYLARPKSADKSHKKPGILLIQEIFGVNDVMRGVAAAYAEAGYVVLCPDLFWRQEPNVELSDRTEKEWERAFALMQGFDLDKGIDDLTAALKSLRKRNDCTGKVGCVGYCLGGQLAYLMACRSDVDAAIGYYGVFIQDYLEEAVHIRHPLLLHLAEEDEFVPKSAQRSIRATLNNHLLVTIRNYVGVNHAFTRVGGKHFDAEATARANQASLEFFEKHLA